MKIMHLKIRQPAAVLITSILASSLFYVFQLLYTHSVNARSSGIYEQSLSASINQFEYLPALLSIDKSLTKALNGSQIDHIEVSKKLKFIAKRSGVDSIFLMDFNGDVKAASNYDNNGGFLYQNYQFRPYFKQAILQEKRQFYYAKGATTGIPGLFIATPIIENSQPIGVTVVKLYLKQWEKQWAESGNTVLVADNNNVIILSTIEKWRYLTIGSVPKTILNNIKEQKQFPGKNHTQLDLKKFNLNNKDVTNDLFWLIDSKLYLVNAFPVSETNWTLYYLINHESILKSTFLFFTITLLILILLLLIINGRQYVLESKNKHKLLELKRREELQAVMDNIHTGVVLLSRSGILLSANQHAEHLLLSNNNISDDKALHINQLVNISSDLDTLLLKDTDTPAYHESATITDSNSTPVMFAISTVNILDQDAYLMTIVNIQRRKNAENELKKINENLENIIKERSQELEQTQKALSQKNKAAALGNMAATIVHELSQPLTAINSSIAAVQAKLLHNNLTGASDSARRLSPLIIKMQEVIKLLKFFSYQDQDSHKIVSAQHCIQSTLDNLKDTFTQKNITILTQINIEDDFINVNPIKFDIVISNIIQNAIDELEDIESPKINITLIKNEKNIKITIQDNGNGIDKNIMNKMFNPFFTTKEVGKGTGLGLAITYEIIQEYSGQITVENNPQGACFYITLPLVNHSSLTTPIT